MGRTRRRDDEAALHVGLHHRVVVVVFLFAVTGVIGRWRGRISGRMRGMVLSPMTGVINRRHGRSKGRIRGVVLSCVTGVIFSRIRRRRMRVPGLHGMLVGRFCGRRDGVLRVRVRVRVRRVIVIARRRGVDRVFATTTGRRQALPNGRLCHTRRVEFNRHAPVHWLQADVHYTLQASDATLDATGAVGRQELGQIEAGPLAALI